MNITLLLTHVAEWLGVLAVAWFLGSIPRFKPVITGFKYARRDGIMGLTLALTAVLFAFTLASPQLQSLAPRFFPLQGSSAELVRPLFTALVTLLPVLAATFLRGQPLRGTGWGRSGSRAGMQAGLAVALLTILLRNRALDLINGLKSEEITYLLLALGIALAEETIFRGYIQLRLSWWMGETRGWIITSLAYAAFRLPLLLLATGSADITAIAIPLVIALGQGLVAGFLMRKSGHILAPALYRAVSIWMNVFV